MKHFYSKPVQFLPNFVPLHIFVLVCNIFPQYIYVLVNPFDVDPLTLIFNDSTTSLRRLSAVVTNMFK